MSSTGMEIGSKPAVQQRSRATRDRIVDALERLLRKKDFQDISIGELADEAGVSPGSIYRRFQGGQVSVLLELCRVIIERRAASPAARLDLETAQGLHEALRQVTLIAWDQLQAHAHVYRAAFLHARLRPDLIGAEREQLDRKALGGVRALLEAYRKEVVRKDLDRAAAAVAYLLNTMLVERALFSDVAPDWKALPKEKAFTAEMADVAYAYLTSKERR